MDDQQAAVANPPLDSPRIRPHLIYDDPAAAIAWLTRAFGFRERTAARHTLPDGNVQRTQIEVRPNHEARGSSGGRKPPISIVVARRASRVFSSAIETRGATASARET